MKVSGGVWRNLGKIIQYLYWINDRNWMVPRQAGEMRFKLMAYSLLFGYKKT